MSARVLDTTQRDRENVINPIKTTETPAEAISIINGHFCAKLSRLLMVDMEELQMGACSVASYGIDSIIGAELRTWIFRE